MNLLDRVTATQKTVDAFLGKDFEWGVADCAILAATHVENFGHETVRNKARKYTTALGAKRAMKLLGVNSMEDFVDAYGFERVPPAATLPGDLVAFPGGEEGAEWSALGVVVDAGEHLIGFALGKCLKGPTRLCTAAWRVK